MLKLIIIACRIPWRIYAGIRTIISTQASPHSRELEGSPRYLHRQTLPAGISLGPFQKALEPTLELGGEDTVQMIQKCRNIPLFHKDEMKIAFLEKITKRANFTRSQLRTS